MPGISRPILGSSAALALGALLACGGTPDTFLTVSRSGSVVDRTRPTVIGTAPAPGAVNVPTTSLIVVTFSEPIDSASVTTASLSLTEGSIATVRVTGSSVTFVPYAGLPPGTTIGAAVSRIRDRAGNTVAPYEWSFTTAAVGH